MGEATHPPIKARPDAHKKTAPPPTFNLASQTTLQVFLIIQALFLFVFTLLLIWGSTQSPTAIFSVHRFLQNDDPSTTKSPLDSELYRQSRPTEQEAHQPKAPEIAAHTTRWRTILPVTTTAILTQTNTIISTTTSVTTTTLGLEIPPKTITVTVTAMSEAKESSTPPGYHLHNDCHCQCQLSWNDPHLPSIGEVKPHIDNSAVSYNSNPATPSVNSAVSESSAESNSQAQASSQSQTSVKIILFDILTVVLSILGICTYPSLTSSLIAASAV